MTRLNLLILLALVVSALMLVHSQYEARRLFMALEVEHKESTRLDIEHDRLQVERRAQATSQRVEQIARQQLQMRMVTPAITQYLSAGAVSASSPRESRP